MAEKGGSNSMVDAPNPLLSLISKFTQTFNFRFPPPPAEKDVVKFETDRKAQVTEVSKQAVVRFPVAGTPSVPSLKLEADQVEQDTNPVVLCQVYAIGGFFVMRWVLARWKERKANKKSPNQDSPSPGADE